MNKFAIWASSFLLFAFFCYQDSQALVSIHRKKHKTPQLSQHTTESSRSGKHHRSKHHLSKAKHSAPRPRYAYPMGFFLLEPPAFDSTPLSEDISTQIKKAFYSGNADDYPTRSLIRSGIISYYPMRGGIFWRREPIKYLVMHSTEPGIPVGAKTIIDGWSHGGRRHAGAHYVIDRDGTIYQAVDPDLATVHVNIFKTLPGINNDNSIGVEMCHQGGQDYPPALVESAARLATYLQNHYHIADANIITHRYAQQGDHTDPVNFAWDNFIAQKDTLQNQGLNQKLALLKTQMFNWQPIVEQPTIVVVDKKATPTVSKPNSPQPVVPRIIEVQTKPQPKLEQTVQSPFEAKFGPIDKPQMQPALEAAPLPSSTVPATSAISRPNNNANNLSTNPPTDTNRLIPTPSTTRLIPVTMIINTQSNNNAVSRPNVNSPVYAPAQNTQSNEQILPTNGRKLPVILPLRGPIEMEPDEAPLLSQ